jgi:hypothetical protein
MDAENFDAVTTNPDATVNQADDTDVNSGDVSAPEGTEVVDGEESGESEVSEPEAKEPEKESGLQKRINEITRKRREAEADAAVLRREVEMLRQAKAEQARTPEPEALKPPREDDYTSLVDYQDAMIDYKVASRIQAQEQQARQNADKERQQSSQAQAQAEKQQRLGEIIESGQKRYKDFDTVAMAMPGEGGPVVSGTMLDAIIAADNGPDVAYYLGKAVAESKRIAALPQAKQMIEIGRISEKIASGKKTVTKATPPITPTGGRAKVNVDVSKMTDEEWARYRQEQKRAARK